MTPPKVIHVLVGEIQMQGEGLGRGLKIQYGGYSIEYGKGATLQEVGEGMTQWV